MLWMRRFLVLVVYLMLMLAAIVVGGGAFDPWMPVDVRVMFGALAVLLVVCGAVIIPAALQMWRRDEGE